MFGRWKTEDTVAFLSWCQEVKTIRSLNGVFQQNQSAFASSRDAKLKVIYISDSEGYVNICQGNGSTTSLANIVDV